jgi:hypothetical protein
MQSISSSDEGNGRDPGVKVRSGQLVLNEMMEHPEGFLRISVNLLDDIPEGRLCAVKLTAKLENHPRGSYALVNLTTEVADGDLVLIGADKMSMQVMRLRKSENGWRFQPVKRSRLQPWFVSDLSLVMGKVEKIFDCED